MSELGKMAEELDAAQKHIEERQRGNEGMMKLRQAFEDAETGRLNARHDLAAEREARARLEEDANCQANRLTLAADEIERRGKVIAEKDKVLKKVEEKQWCDVCAGTKQLLTGKSCACKDGTVFGLVNALREAQVKVKAERDELREKVKAVREALKEPERCCETCTDKTCTLRCCDGHPDRNFPYWQGMPLEERVKRVLAATGDQEEG